jgi:hypothetical protein
MKNKINLKKIEAFKNKYNLNDKILFYEKSMEDYNDRFN